MGGLDDLIPDDADTSSTSSSRSTSSSSGPEYVKEFHSNNGIKKFTEERWEEIKTEIRHKTEYTVGEVETMEANRRHKVLHEMAISSEHNKDPSELEHGTDVQCPVCGCDCSMMHAIIEGEPVCIDHTVAKVANNTDLEIKNNDE